MGIFRSKMAAILKFQYGGHKGVAKFGTIDFCVPYTLNKGYKQ